MTPDEAVMNMKIQRIAMAGVFNEHNVRKYIKQIYKKGSTTEEVEIGQQLVVACVHQACRLIHEKNFSIADATFNFLQCISVLQSIEIFIGLDKLQQQVMQDFPDIQKEDVVLQMKQGLDKSMHTSKKKKP